jgi:hypothetical protein
LIKNATNLTAPNSLDAYHKIVPYLAKLRRKHRARLAKELLIRVERCENQPISFGGIKFEEYEEGYAVLASTWKRHDTQVALFNIGRAIGFKLNVKTVVCLAMSTDQLQFPKDAMVIDLTKGTASELPVELTENLLGAVEIQNGNPA